MKSKSQAWARNGYGFVKRGSLFWASSARSVREHRTEVFSTVHTRLARPPQPEPRDQRAECRDQTLDFLAWILLLGWAPTHQGRTNRLFFSFSVADHLTSLVHEHAAWQRRQFVSPDGQTGFFCCQSWVLLFLWATRTVLSGLQPPTDPMRECRRVC